MEIRAWHLHNPGSINEFSGVLKQELLSFPFYYSENALCKEVVIM